MSQMIGMDPEVVLALAGRLSSQADTLSGIVGGVDRLVHVVGAQWRGQDGTDFLESWQRTHRPALVAVQGAIAGLAESARHNAHQQVEASAAVGGGPAGVSPLMGSVHEAESLSRRFGWVAAPAVALVPGASVVLSADSTARLGQDLAEHRYMDAFQAGSSQVSSNLLTEAVRTKDPTLALGALDVTLWSDVVVTASHDHVATFTTWSGVLGTLHAGGLQAADQMLEGTVTTVGDQLGGMGEAFGKEAWGALGGLFS